MSTIIFDIDGVILDFNLKFVNWMKNKYNIELELNPVSYDHCDDFPGSHEKLYEYIHEFVDHEEEHLDTICSEIAELPRKLHKLGFRIVMITAYRNQEARKKNLAELNIYYDQIIFDDNKLPYVQEIAPICCIEDRPKTVKLYNDNNIPTLVPGYWNYTQELKGDFITKYRDTQHLEELIIKLSQKLKNN